ncbi:MAG: EamA family transporter [Bacteroidetes bacterium]|nr:EamA family transporter [Bacteroidota bacterium]
MVTGLTLPFLSTNLKVHLSLLVVSLIYGATFSMAKVIMPSLIAPYGFILLRILSGCLLFFMVHSLFVREKVEKKDLFPLAVSALFGVAANMLMFFKGLSITTPINGAVLMLVTPVFVLILSSVIYKESMHWRKSLGVFLAGGGALFLIGGWKLSFDADKVIGDVLVMLNALSYAIYLVYVKRLMKKYNPITVSKWNFIFGLLIVFPFGCQELYAVDWSMFGPAAWGIVAFILLGTTFLTYLLNAYALGHASATLVGSYIYLQPVVAAILAIMLKQDSLNYLKVIYILTIFAGVYLVSLKKSRNGN